MNRLNLTTKYLTYMKALTTLYNVSGHTLITTWKIALALDLLIFLQVLHNIEYLNWKQLPEK